MKYPIAIVFLLLFVGCSKDSNNGNPAQYIGEWELESSVGSIPGIQTYARGNGHKVIFTRDSLTRYINSVFYNTVAYTLEKDSCWAFGDAPKILDRLLLDGDKGGDNDASASFLELKNNKLTMYISIPALDGGNSTYRRLKP